MPLLKKLKRFTPASSKFRTKQDLLLILHQIFSAHMFKSKQTLVIKLALVMVGLVWPFAYTHATPHFDDIHQSLTGKTTQQLMEMGKESAQQGNYEHALTCFSSVIGRASTGEVDRHILVKAYTNCGVIYSMSASYDRAYDSYMHAMKLSDSTEINQSYNNIAGIHFMYKEYDKALDYVDCSFAITENSKKYNDLASAMQNIINIFYETGELEKATPYIERFKKVENPTASYKWNYTEKLVSGIENVICHKYQEAISQFAQSIAMTDNDTVPNANRMRFSIAGYTYMADTYILCGNVEQAINLYLKAMDIAHNGDYPALRMQLANSLSHAYTLKNDVLKATEYKELYINLKDSVLDAGAFGKIKDLQFYSEIDNYKKQVSQLATERRERNLVIVAVIIILALLTMLLLVIIRNYRRLGEQNKVLFRRNKEYMEALEQERNARTQMLKYRSSRLGDEEKDDLIVRIKAVTDNIDTISSPDFSLETLASLVNNNVHNVSQVINEKLSINFKTYLNNLRIAEVCRRLSNFEDYGNQTIEGIASSVGFRGYSHFCRTFKKVTGLTPGEYQRLAHNNEPDCK